MHGILVVHYMNGGRSKVKLERELKRLNEALSDFDVSPIPKKELYLSH